MTASEPMNYIEMPASDLEGTKKFFADVFGWEFQDYGPDYIAVLNAGIDGGFYRSSQVARTDTGSVLVVLKSSHLEATLQRVEQAGGTIIKAIFEFPGGRRFHFTDPSGNEYAVWSE